MSDKPKFNKAPKPKSKPTPEQVEAFVTEGIGTDEKPAKAKPGPKTTREPEKLKRLTFEVPTSLHAKFKGLCGIAGLKMTDELAAFVESRVAELEKSTK